MGAPTGLTILLLLVPPPAALAFDPGGGFSNNIAGDTRLCLTCHDGTLAANFSGQYFTPARDGFRSTMPGNTLAMSHPVGVDYRMAQLKSGAKLRDPLFLDPAVKLENGLVGCTSCHDANSELPAKLVMLNTGSRLCFACHDL